MIVSENVCISIFLLVFQYHRSSLTSKFSYFLGGEKTFFSLRTLEYSKEVCTAQAHTGINTEKSNFFLFKNNLNSTLYVSSTGEQQTIFFPCQNVIFRSLFANISFEKLWKKFYKKNFQTTTTTTNSELLRRFEYQAAKSFIVHAPMLFQLLCN